MDFPAKQGVQVQDFSDNGGAGKRMSAHLADGVWVGLAEVT